MPEEVEWHSATEHVGIDARANFWDRKLLECNGMEPSDLDSD